MNNIVTLTKKLISVPSTSDNTAELTEVLDIAKQELTEFSVEEFEHEGIPSLLVYNTEVRPTSFKVILNAHLDVVPAKPEQYHVKEKDGKLYGRGTWDMKAAAAAQIMVFKEVAKQVGYPLALQLVTDEETGGFHGTKYQIDEGVSGEFIIAGEPTDLGINNEAKGIIWATVTIKGRTAHAAYPWNGENAIERASKFVQKISEVFPTPEGEEWKTTVNIASIDSQNKTFNKVPDECSISLDVRFVPSDTDTIKEKIESLLPQNSSIEYLTYEPAQFTDKEDTYIKQLAEIVAETTGEEAEIIVKHGGSDVRHYERVGNHGVTFGPKGAGLHGDDEWVDIKSLEDFTAILRNFLLIL